MKFISFSSGSSGNCYFIFTEHDGLMIDAGVGVRQLKKDFVNYGLSMSSIKNILLTHDHADHVKSVGSLCHDLMVPVYSTKKVHRGVEGNYCVRRKIELGLARFLEKNVTVEIGDFKVTPFDVPHDSQDNVGYLIQHGDTKFCMVTDVGCVTEEIGGFISSADYLVLEANHDIEMLRSGTYPYILKQRIASERGHLSNHDCGEALVRYATERLKHVWLCHLSNENNHPELARKTVEYLLQSHGITPGKDFLLDVLNRTRPTGIFSLE